MKRSIECEFPDVGSVWSKDKEYFICKRDDVMDSIGGADGDDLPPVPEDLFGYKKDKEGKTP